MGVGQARAHPDYVAFRYVIEFSFVFYLPFIGSVPLLDVTAKRTHLPKPLWAFVKIDVGSRMVRPRVRKWVLLKYESKPHMASGSDDLNATARPKPLLESAIVPHWFTFGSYNEVRDGEQSFRRWADWLA